MALKMSSQSSTSLTATTAAVGEEKKGGVLTFLQNKTLVKKIVPQMLMMFCILFNYTILRDTKDVLVVTAPGSGAEIIPFLKTYVQLPGAILFTLLYGALSNRMSQAKVFYSIVGAFLAFFGAFAGVIYPAREFLHPNLLADAVSKVAPAFFLPIIAIFRNWTYAMFYLMAELWGSVVLSLLFWGFANEINTVDEAKSYYPLFGLVANVALIFSGQYVRLVSMIRAGLPDGVDKWGHSLKLLMAAVVGGGAALLGIFEFMQQKVFKSHLSIFHFLSLFLSVFLSHVVLIACGRCSAVCASPHHSPFCITHYPPVPHSPTNPPLSRSHYPPLSRFHQSTPLSPPLSTPRPPHPQVITDPECVVPKDPECVDEKKAKKPKMTAGESFKFLANSPYIRDLATLVVSYG